MTDVGLCRYRTLVAARECLTGCTNEAPVAGKSALVDRAMLICFATRNGSRENGPIKVANKSTQLALSKRPVFVTWMKLLHSKVVHYWSLHAGGCTLPFVRVFVARSRWMRARFLWLTGRLFVLFSRRHRD